MNFSYLICVPSPRDISEFQEALDELNKEYDVFLAKYYERVEAYRKIREFILSHKQYRVVALIPDDLIVTKDGLEKLLEHHVKYPNAVISGICNFDMYRNSNKYCFRVKGDYGSYPKINELDKYLALYKARPYNGEENLYKVTFNGFACVIIPRKIVEKIPFRTKIPYGQGGSSVNEFFCGDCIENGIDLLADISVRFQHLAYRLKRNELENSGVGIKDPYIIFMSRKRK